MIPLPSTLNPEKFLVYVVGPVGGAAVGPTRTQIEKSNTSIDTTLADYASFEEKRDIVLDQIKHLFSEVQENPGKGQDNYIQAGSLVLWLMRYDPNPMVRENYDEMEWLTFAVVGGEMLVEFGHGDDDFTEAREMVVSTYEEMHNVELVKAPQPTRH